MSDVLLFVQAAADTTRAYGEFYGSFERRFDLPDFSIAW